MGIIEFLLTTGVNGYIISFLGNNFLIFLIFGVILKEWAKGTKSVTDDKISTFLGNTMDGILALVGKGKKI